jgi:ribonuclease P protein component
MLPKTQRLRRMRDFALLSQKGRAVFAPFFTLRLRQSQTPTKIGFVASAKVFKTAVARNRVKRRMREVLRLIKNDWPVNFDLLFVLKPDILTVDFKLLTSAVQHAFEKIPEAMTKPPQPRKPKARRKTSVVFEKEK